MSTSPTTKTHKYSNSSRTHIPTHNRGIQKSNSPHNKTNRHKNTKGRKSKREWRKLKRMQKKKKKSEIQQENPTESDSNGDSGQKKGLVVLDLNGTLLHRDFKRDFDGNGGLEVESSPDFSNRFYRVWKRPNISMFFKCLFEMELDVAVWSSAKRHNTSWLVSNLLSPNLRSRLLFEWDREKTDPRPTKENEHCTVKNLEKVWKDFPYTSENTVLIDDTIEKCVQSEEICWIIPSYDPTSENDIQLEVIMERLRKKFEINV
eukprot:TRINITY_DN4455_c0_g1_i1.p1 TRINITY_DN4455_c0_g1~~TRINITY_DN4455_c0_g1_i1.p1  ORF type:complete len:261 (+),score=45.77 TRINITY_DN4455_c0_g1_i1:176-958(+)